MKYASPVISSAGDVSNSGRKDFNWVEWRLFLHLGVVVQFVVLLAGFHLLIGAVSHCQVGDRLLCLAHRFCARVAYKDALIADATIVSMRFSFVSGEGWLLLTNW